MRTLLAGIIALAFVQTAAAQTVLKREPYYLPTGAVVFVDSGQCGVGKVLKVTGIGKGHLRRKACISLDAREAFLPTSPQL